jgi:uncharacterized SAM-binding protein YcdF (DUF218 family)
MQTTRLSFWRLATVVLVLAGLVGWLGRESLLRKAADLWIVSDPLTRADAIVVLGGNSRTRPREAADLYRKGLASKVLVSKTGRSDQSAPGIGPSECELNRAALLKVGVPDSAIEAFGKANANTREEAVALREWTERNAASVFIIPTEIFTARRVQWIFRREFSGRSVIIEVALFEPPGYSREQWWKSEMGLSAFQDEILKYTYYRWMY